ncbi:MAG: SDR family NAD(P)-dependent oxidoreductase [Actinomycetota bacterium]
MIGSDPTETVQLFPTSNNQVQLWFAQEYDEGNPQYNTFIGFEVDGTIDTDAFQAAIDDLVDRHEPLRTTFAVVDGELQQVVAPRLAVPLRQARVTAAELDDVLRTAVEQPFDLERGPLLRMHVFSVDEAPDDAPPTVVLLEFHHILVDGWSGAILLDDLAEAYRARRRGEAPGWAPLDIQLADYVEHQSEQADAPHRVGERNWWAEYLREPPAPPAIALDRPRTVPAPPEAGRTMFDVPDELHVRLDELARRLRCSPPTLAITAFAALVAARSGASEVTVGVPQAGRVRPETERLVGFLVTTIPVRLAHDPERSFAAAAVDTRNRIAEAASPQELSLDEIVTASRPPRVEGHTTLFDILVVTQNTSDLALDLDGLETRMIDVPASWTRFDLELNLWDDQPLRAMLTHRSSIIDDTSAATMIDRLIALLDLATRRPDASWTELLTDLAAVAPPVDRSTTDDAEAVAVVEEVRSVLGVGDAFACRARTDDGDRLVVYAVPEVPGLDEQRILTAGRQVVPELAGVALVRRIPRDRLGAVDFTALEGALMVDDGLLGRWRNRLDERGVADAEVAVDWHPDEPPTRDVPGAPGGGASSGAGSSAPSPGTRVDAVTTPADRATTGEPPPAISDGGPARPIRFADLGEALEAAAVGGRSITFLDDRGAPETVTYAALLDEARRLAAGMGPAGLTAGDVVPVAYARNRSVVPLLWAGILAGVGIAPFPHRPEVGGLRQRLAQVRARLGPTMIVADELDGVLVEAGLDPTTGIPAAALAGDGADGPDRPFERPAVDLDRPAVVLLTSGSTAAPKAVPVTHRMILTRSEGAAAACGVGADDVSMNWMPLDHVGGVVMFHLRDVVLGCDQIQAPTTWVLADPLRWLDTVDAYRVSTTWAPNFAFGLVADEAARLADRTLDLSCLRHILNGGEAVRPDAVARFLDAATPHGLPADAVRPAWGMSETCSGETDAAGYDPRIGAPALAAHPEIVSVGRPYPGFAMRIVDEAGAIATEGAVGQLQVRGDAVFGGYLNDDEGRNREAFVVGWFRTGDLALLVDGELYITGRDKGDILLSGVNVSCEVVEDLVETTGMVERSFTIAIGLPDTRAGGEYLTVFAAPVPGHDLHDVATAVDRVIVDRYAQSPTVVLLDRAAIPKTNIGKRQRTLLRERHEGGELQPLLVRDRAGERARTVTDVVRRIEWCPEGRIHPPANPERVAVIGAATERNRDMVALLTDAGIDTRLFEAGSDEGAVAAVTAALADGAELIAIADRARNWSNPHDAALQAVATQVHYRRLLAPILDDGVGPDANRCRELVVVADDVSATPGTGQLNLPGGVLRGLIESADIETDRVRCRLVATTPDTPAAELVAELLAREVGATVAVTPQGRFAPRLARVGDGVTTSTITDRLRPGAPILVTGGLGGVGKAVVAHLRAHHQARLLLVGRRDPEAARADLDTLGIGPDDPAVTYVALDVSRPAALADAVARAETRWGAPLAGAFHLASHSPVEEPIARSVDLEPELERTVGANLAAKVEGAGALATVLADRPDAFLVLYSSVAGIFGFATGSDYAAANSFLDLLAHSDQGPTFQSLAWGGWAESISTTDQLLASLAYARGVSAMSNVEALDSLDAALTIDERLLVVGVDDTRHWAASRSTRPASGLRAVSITTDARSANELRSLPTEALAVTDVLGFATPPLVTADTGGDGSPGGPPDLQGIPPGSAEQLVHTIWSDLLRIDSIDRHATFFDLGGTSVLLSRVQGRLEQEGYDVGLVELFANCTIASLGWFLDQPAPGAAGVATAALDGGADRNGGEPQGEPLGRRRAAARRRRRNR